MNIDGKTKSTTHTGLGGGGVEKFASIGRVHKIPHSMQHYFKSIHVALSLWLERMFVTYILNCEGPGLISFGS